MPQTPQPYIRHWFILIPRLAEPDLGIIGLRALFNLPGIICELEALRLRGRYVGDLTA